MGCRDSSVTLSLRLAPLLVTGCFLGPGGSLGVGWPVGAGACSLGLSGAPELVCQPLLSSWGIALFMPALWDDLAFVFSILGVSESASGNQVEVFYWCCFC